MEAEQIEVVKKWPEPKSVQDIQVFLGFANFYHWFIKNFSKIAASLTSMLKTTMLLQVLAANKVLGAKVLAANEVGDVGDGDGLSDRSKYVEPKTGRLENQKTSKSRNLAKSKKQSKSGNSPKFDATKAGPSFLTPKARATFNRLRLAFIKAPILWHFESEYHIWIKTDALSYAISGVLS